MLESIMIRNWKLFENLNFKFKPGLNFISGPNAIGKTSLLEAIYYAITGDLRRSSQIVKTFSFYSIRSVSYKIRY
jgi:DNA replication and repair protein RecF